MTRVTFKGIAARPVRTLLTAIAIVLGVAMISGALTLSDTLRHAANSLTSSSYRGTDAVVQARTAFDIPANQGNVTPPTVPAGLLGQVRSVPQVGLAVGDLTNYDTRIIDAHGKVSGTGPYFGVGFDARVPGARRLTPFRIRQGHFATAPDQVVIDAGTAAQQHIGVGGRVRVQARGPVQTFTVSGIATFGSIKSIGTATFAVFDLPTAQQLFGEAGRYDSILVAARPEVGAAAMRSALAGAIPGWARVDTPAKQDRFDLTGLKQFVSIIEIVLLAFGGVAIFVGGFTIANALSITVAQRSRELALLRTLGSSRRQVLGSVLTEALTIGSLASLLGLFAGLGLGKGLSSVMASLGLDLPQAGTVFAAHTAIVSLLVGIGVTALAGLAPARRATRVAPLAALRDGEDAEAGAVVRAPRKAMLISGWALGMLLAGMFARGLPTGARMALIGPGCLLLFIGVALLSPRIARPLASALGGPAARFGGSAGRLARGNAMRNPRRTAATASALMIGVALVVFLAVVARGMRQSATSSIRSQIRADYVVTASDGYSPIPPSVAAAAASVPGATVSGIAESQVQAFGHRVAVDGVDPATFAGAYRFDWKSGSDAAVRTLGRNGAIVDDALAHAHRLTLGSRFAVQTPTRGRLELVVRGIERPVRLNALGLGAITMSSQAFEAAFANAQDRMVLVSATGTGVEAVLNARLAQYPDVKVSTPAAFAADQVKWLASVLAIFYVLLAVAVIISLFGIVNTLVLSVLERTRELGTLRTLGMSRRQVRRMIRHESVITALIGAAQGIALGLGLAALVTTALRGEGLQFAVPASSLVGFVAVAVLAGMAAAILPARRASRLKPVAALAYE